ncbi:hypothetical protein MKW92_026359, partial [Papaver armeniacum]
MYRRVDMGLEDEVLLLTVIVHEMLDTLDGYIPASLIEVVSMDDLTSLKRSLLIILDILYSETSKEKKLILHLSFPHINECLKDNYGNGEKSTAAMRSWMTTLRMLLCKLNDAMDDMQREGNHSLSELSITSLVDSLNVIINDQPSDPHNDIRKLLTFRHSCTIERPEDESAVIKLLLEPLVNRDIGVIPIVGDAGCGKSILAKLVYNNQRVKGHFDLKMWVSFPDSYPDVLKFTLFLIDFVSKSITINLKKKQKNKLRAAREAFATGNTNFLDISSELNHLHTILGELLSGRKFLLALDGVSIETCCDWNVLRTPLLAGENSSKILLTTRSSKVSSLLRTIQPYYPQPL